MKTVSVPAATSTLQPPLAALKLMSDERLARWAAKGSESAFAVIFERHHQALHRYCHSIVGNGHDAADALQSTMVKALGALPGERRTIALKPWLYRIAHNESISLVRTRRGDSNLDAAAEIGDPAADTIAESRERLRELTADLEELSDQQRGALLMRELGGLAFADVAGALQVSATAAKQSVYEARCALQALEDGRAMDCDGVRRTLSDGDRRTLRGMRLRGHLRACAGCRDFAAALRHRPAQLAAISPPLPLAAAATILHSLLGGSANHGGGGLLAGLGAGAQTSGALSSGAAKVAAVAVLAGGAAGGAVYVAPDGPAQRSGGAPITRESAAPDERAGSALATRRGADGDARRARSAERSADAGSGSTPRAAAEDERTDAAGGSAQRPSIPAAAAPASSAARQPASGTGARRRPAAGTARDGGAGRRPQTIPAPAARDAPATRPASRPANAPATPPIPAGSPSPATAPVPTTAPVSTSAPVLLPSPAPAGTGAIPGPRAR